MPDGTLPTPEKRKRATPRQIREILERQNGCCAMCGIQLVDLGDEWVRIINAFQIDHIQRLDALGSQTLDNLQALCVPDHKEKTRTDNREAKKGARVRGETGQRARREKRGGSSIQGRGFMSPADRRKLKAKLAELRAKRPLEDFYIAADPIDGSPTDLPFPKPKRRAA